MAELIDYKIFVRVIAAGSLSAAGRELNLSPAMISKRLANLEENAGARLIQRTTRRLRLTQIGHEFHARACNVLAAVDDAEAIFLDETKSVRGLLRVSAPTSFARLHIVPHLKSFLDKYPDLEMDINLDDEFVDLIGQGYDLAVRIGVLPDSSVVARRFATNNRIFCAAVSYLEKFGEPTCLSDLEHHRLLIATPSAQWRIRGPEGPITLQPKSAIRTNSSEVVRGALLSSMGIGFRSTWDVYEDLRRNIVRRVLPAYRGIEDVGIYAVYPTKRLVPARVSAFIDHLAEAFGREPYWDRDLLL